MTSEALALLISGAASAIGAGAIGWNTIRNGAAARQKDLLDEAQEERDEARHERRQEARRRRFAEEHILKQAALMAREGMEAPPYTPPEWVPFEVKKK